MKSLLDSESLLEPVDNDTSEDLGAGLTGNLGDLGIDASDVSSLSSLSRGQLGDALGLSQDRSGVSSIAGSMASKGLGISSLDNAIDGLASLSKGDLDAVAGTGLNAFGETMMSGVSQTIGAPFAGAVGLLGNTSRNMSKYGMGVDDALGWGIAELGFDIGAAVLGGLAFGPIGATVTSMLGSFVDFGAMSEDISNSVTGFGRSVNAFGAEATMDVREALDALGITDDIGFTSPEERSMTVDTLSMGSYDNPDSALDAVRSSRSNQYGYDLGGIGYGEDSGSGSDGSTGDSRGQGGSRGGGRSDSGGGYR